MRKDLRFIGLAMLLSLPAAACDCAGEPPTVSKAELGLSPAFLTWGEVCNDADDYSIVTVENKGRANLKVDLSIEGRDAQYFSVADEQKTFNLAGAAARMDVHVLHRSIGAERGKTHQATLVVTPSVGDVVEVPLRADVADVEGAPALVIGCASALPLCKDAPDDACCQTSNVDMKATTRSLSFGSPAVGEIAVLRANIVNAGCAPLQVTGVRIEKLPGDTCESLVDEHGDTFEQVVLNGFEPFTLTGTTDPSQVHSREIEFVFSPEVKPCMLNRKFVVVSNDPNAPPDGEGSTTTTAASGLLGGEAGQGVLLINPNPAVYQEANGKGIKVGETKTIAVVVRNPTTSEVTIDSIQLLDYKANPKQNGSDLYTIDEIVQGPTGGTPIPLGQPIVLAKNQFDPNSVPDRITLKITYAPTRPGYHLATLQVNHAAAATKATRGLLQGESNPKLVVYPDDVFFSTANAAGCSGNGVECSALNCNSAFACDSDGDCGVTGKCLDGICGGKDGTWPMAYCSPICGQVDKTIAVCNEGIAPLEIESLHLEGVDVGSPVPIDPQWDDRPVFAVTDGCAGQTLEPGACCHETVQYQDVRQGGANTATLVVKSNDVSWSTDPHGGMPVPVRSDTTEQGNREPVTPAQLTLTPDIPRAGGWVTFSADGAYAPYGDQLTYKWWLKAVPTGATAFKTLPLEIKPNDPNKDCPASVHGGDCFRFSPDGKSLSFWPEREQYTYTFEVEVAGSLCAPNVFKRKYSGNATIGSQDGT